MTQDANVIAEFRIVAESSVPPDDDYEFNNHDLFVLPPTTGKVPVFVFPGSSVAVNDATTFSFGIPFPRGLVGDVSELRVTDTNGVELASHVEELVRWRSLSGDTSVDSVRAALVYVEAVFPDHNSMVLEVHYGTERTLELGLQGPVNAAWVPITDGPFPGEYPASEGLMEPAVYVTLPPDWLGITLLRSRTTVAFEDPDWDWFDRGLVNFAHTAVNDVSDAVTAENRIDYVHGYAPWLFDRALTLFGVYVRTGDVKWLRHAHRAAQFYAAHINAAGAFDLKAYNDHKYSYGQSMLIDLMLTGDTRLLEPIERVASFTQNFALEVPAINSSKLWTERHMAYSLLGALSWWEATGLGAERVLAVARSVFAQADNPPNGWVDEGCILHTLGQHEGGNDESAICSPWMGVLLGEAVWRYYLHSQDSDAVRYLADFGDYLVNHGTYAIKGQGPEIDGLVVPHYLASSNYEFPDSDPWSDLEHSCDVAGSAARAAWAKEAAGADNTTLVNLTNQLLTTCRHVFEIWHRPDADINYGKAEWRLSPPRKFNWWFGTTLDLEWLTN
jgi:hypothetical protein